MGARGIVGGCCTPHSFDGCKGGQTRGRKVGHRGLSKRICGDAMEHKAASTWSGTAQKGEDALAPGPGILLCGSTQPRCEAGLAAGPSALCWRAGSLARKLTWLSRRPRV